MNRLLRMERLRKGWTQQLLADFAAISLSTVERAEQGKSVRIDNIQRLCKCLDRTPEQLGLVWIAGEPGQYENHPISIGQDIEDDEVMKRRSFLQTLAGIGLAASIAPTRLSLNEELIPLLESDMVARWELYYTAGPVRASAGLGTWMKTLVNWAQSIEEPSWLRRVQTLLTIGYQLQSCVARDLMEYRQAHIAYQAAFNIAQELESPELIAAALAREGVTLTQQEKPKDAIIYLTGSLNILDGPGFPVLAGHILQALSEAYAKVGQPHESWASIDQAEKTLTGREQLQEHSLIRGVTPASIAAQKGVNAVLLHDYRQAIRLIDDGLKTYNQSLIRARSRLFAQKAEAFFRLDQLDACVTTAQEALGLATAAGAAKTIGSIKTLHTALAESRWWHEQPVIQLGRILAKTG